VGGGGGFSFQGHSMGGDACNSQDHRGTHFNEKRETLSRVVHSGKPWSIKT